MCSCLWVFQTRKNGFSSNISSFSGCVAQSGTVRIYFTIQSKHLQQLNAYYIYISPNCHLLEETFCFPVSGKQWDSRFKNPKDHMKHMKERIGCINFTPCTPWKYQMPFKSLLKEIQHVCQKSTYKLLKSIEPH